MIPLDEAGGIGGGAGAPSRKRKVREGREGCARGESCCPSGSRKREQPAHVTPRATSHEERATHVRQKEGTGTITECYGSEHRDCSPDLPMRMHFTLPVPSSPSQASVLHSLKRSSGVEDSLVNSSSMLPVSVTLGPSRDSACLSCPCAHDAHPRASRSPPPIAR